MNIKNKSPMEGSQKKIKVDGGSAFFSAIAHRVADLVSKDLFDLQELVIKSELTHCGACDKLRSDYDGTCESCGKDFCESCDYLTRCDICYYRTCKDCMDDDYYCTDCVNDQIHYCEAKDCAIQILGKTDYCEGCGENPVCVDHSICEFCVKFERSEKLTFQ